MLPFVVIGALMTILIRVISIPLVSTVGVSVPTLLVEMVVGVAFFCVLAFAYCIATKNKHFHRIIGARGKSQR